MKEKGEYSIAVRVKPTTETPTLLFVFQRFTKIMKFGKFSFWALLGLLAREGGEGNYATRGD